MSFQAVLAGLPDLASTRVRLLGLLYPFGRVGNGRHVTLVQELARCVSGEACWGWLSSVRYGGSRSNSRGVLYTRSWCRCSRARSGGCSVSWLWLHVRCSAVALPACRAGLVSCAHGARAVRRSRRLAGMSEAIGGLPVRLRTGVGWGPSAPLLRRRPPPEGLLVLRRGAAAPSGVCYQSRGSDG